MAMDRVFHKHRNAPSNNGRAQQLCMVRQNGAGLEGTWTSDKQQEQALIHNDQSKEDRRRMQKRVSAQNKRKKQSQERENLANKNSELRKERAQLKRQNEKLKATLKYWESIVTMVKLMAQAQPVSVSPPSAVKSQPHVVGDSNSLPSTSFADPSAICSHDYDVGDRPTTVSPVSESGPLYLDSLTSSQLTSGLEVDDSINLVSAEDWRQIPMDADFHEPISIRDVSKQQSPTAGTSSSTSDSFIPDGQNIMAHQKQSIAPDLLPSAEVSARTTQALITTTDKAASMNTATESDLAAIEELLVLENLQTEGKFADHGFGDLFGNLYQELRGPIPLSDPNGSPGSSLFLQRAGATMPDVAIPDSAGHSTTATDSSEAFWTSFDNYI